MEDFLETGLLNGDGPTSTACLELRDGMGKTARHGSKYFIDRTITDIQEHADKLQGNYSSIQKWDTFFFRLVLGGNVDLIREILEYMRDNHKEEELAWATGVEQASLTDRRCKKRRSKGLLRFLTFLLLWVIFAVSTPVFYPLHAIISRMTTNLSARISKKPKLPLVYAVLSGNVDMVRLFLQFGTTLDSCDSQGNNLYHYLGDKSASDSDVFSRSHHLLKEAIDPSHHNLLLEMITGRENELGISPLEMLVLRGSITDFVRLTREEGCVGRLKLAVSSDQVTALSDDSRHIYVTREPDLVKSEDLDPMDGVSNRQDLDTRFHYTEYDFDVTKYEQEDIYNKQSLLLHLLVARKIQPLTKEDISSILGSKFIQKWVARKARSISWCFLLKCAFHLTVTFVLLSVMIREGGDMNPNPLTAKYMGNYADVLKEVRGKYNGTQGEGKPKCPTGERKFGGSVISMCDYKALAKINNTCDISESEILKYAYPEQLKLSPASTLMLDTIKWFLIIYTITDFLQRSLFLARGVLGKTSVRAGLWTVCTRLLPGSYADATINLIIQLLFLLFLFKYKNYQETFKKLYGQANDYNSTLYFYVEMKSAHEDYHEAAGRILVSCLILRFILVIHALRLGPKIGFFIFTSKKMALHLVQFGIVYGIITVIFAVVFYFVMREDDCPAKKRKEFQTILSSIFVVYTLSIGGDDDNVFVETNNITAKIVFMAYTVISVVLLLNLIIAIMTTTAEAVSQQPWKRGLLSMEIWDEVLGVEAVLLTLYSPIVAIRNRVRGNKVRADRTTIPVVYHSWSK